MATPDRRRRFAVAGRIVAPHVTSTVLVGYRVQAWAGDDLVAETTTDGLGRFVLEWHAMDEQKSSVVVRAFAPWNDPAGEILLTDSELLYPSPITFTAVPERSTALLTADRLRKPDGVHGERESPSRVIPPRVFEPPPPRQAASEVVSERDMDLFLSAVSAAVEGNHLRPEEAAWVQQSIADLDRAYVFAREAVLGDLPSLEMLRKLLAPERRWDIPLRERPGLGGRRSPLDGVGDCFVVPRDPLPMIWGPVMLDGLTGGFGWSERALGFFNSRAMPVNAAFNAAADWAAGTIGPGDFAGMLRSYNPARFGQSWEPVRELPPVGFCLSERMVCIGAFLFDLQQYGSQYVSPPPVVGSIVPDAVCADFAGALSLLPPAGSVFPASEPQEWGLVVDGKSVVVQSWDPAEVVIEFPANVKPGCQPIRWVHALDPEFVNHAREIGEQCAPFFGGGGAWSNFPLTIGQTAIHISVIGTPQIRRFTADGHTSLVAEGCVDVKLEWEADVALCGQSSAYLDVSLLRDGNLHQSALASAGSFIVNDDVTATYTLRVEAFDGATRCSFVEQTVQIQRYKALHLDVPPANCVDAGGTLPVNVLISCPAPFGGLTVTLTSSNAARIAGGSVTILEGTIDGYIDLAIGTECGEATITATAAGHQSSSFKRLVSDYPQITAITPPEVNACEPFEVWLDGSCFGESVGQQTVFLTDSNGVPVAGTVVQLQGSTRVLVEFPAMNPGQYPLSMTTSCGKTGSANTLLVVNERRVTIADFTATPGQIVLCPVFIQLTWRVDGARRVRILRNGVLLQGSERTRNQDCGMWEESFDDPQLQPNTVQYTLEAFPASGSPVKTTQRTVSAAARKVFLSLSQQGGSMGAIYNANAADPLALCQIKHAVVTNVKNMSGRDLSLVRVSGEVPIVIDSGKSTSAFNGTVVEGNWTAQVGGAASGLPSQVTFAIDWNVP